MQLLLALIVTVLHQVSCQKKPNNVCPTYRDYFTMLTNSKCWYDFAAEMTVVSTVKNLTQKVCTRPFQPEIIRNTGYPIITYKVRTGDDFHLTVFRIPGLRQDKPPVFMLHGVQSTSGIFVGLGKRSIGEFWLFNSPIKLILTK